MKRGSRVAAGVVVVFLFIQGVPYGRDHRNPPVSGTPAWDSPRTRELAERACFDCHSHGTRWPWYASIAPVSWRVQHHVNEARAHLDFSAFDQPQKNADEAAEAAEKGEMPPFDYLWMHPEARLSGPELAELVRGLEATFGREHDPDGESNSDESHAD